MTAMVAMDFVHQYKPLELNIEVSAMRAPEALSSSGRVKVVFKLYVFSPKPNETTKTHAEANATLPPIIGINDKTFTWKWSR